MQRARKLMLFLVLPMLITLGACSNSTSPNNGALQATADVARPLMDEHARALLGNDPNRTLITGADLITSLDAMLPAQSESPK